VFRRSFDVKRLLCCTTVVLVLSGCPGVRAPSSWEEHRSASLILSAPLEARVSGFEATFEDFPVYEVATNEYRISIDFQPIVLKLERAGSRRLQTDARW